MIFRNGTEIKKVNEEIANISDDTDVFVVNNAHQLIGDLRARMVGNNPNLTPNLSVETLKKIAGCLELICQNTKDVDVSVFSDLRQQVEKLDKNDKSGVRDSLMVISDYFNQKIPNGNSNFDADGYLMSLSNSLKAILDDLHRVDKVWVRKKSFFDTNLEFNYIVGSVENLLDMSNSISDKNGIGRIKDEIGFVKTDLNSKSSYLNNANNGRTKDRIHDITTHVVIPAVLAGGLVVSSVFGIGLKNENSKLRTETVAAQTEQMKAENERDAAKAAQAQAENEAKAAKDAQAQAEKDAKTQADNYNIIIQNLQNVINSNPTAKDVLDLQNQLNTVIAERDAAQAAQKQAESERDAAQAAQKQAESERDAAQAAQIKAEDDVKTLESQISSLQKQLEDEKNKSNPDAGKIADLENQLKAAQAAKAQAEKDAKAAQADKVQSEKDAKAAQAAKEQAEKERDAAKAAQTKAEKDLDDLNAKYAKDIAAANAAKTKAENEAKAAKAAQTKAENERDAAKAAQAAQAAEYAALDKIIDGYYSQFSSDKTKTTVQKLEDIIGYYGSEGAAYSAILRWAMSNALGFEIPADWTDEDVRQMFVQYFGGSYEEIIARESGVNKNNPDSRSNGQSGSGNENNPGTGTGVNSQDPGLAR